jgi:hypothetical protein
MARESMFLPEGYDINLHTLEIGNPYSDYVGFPEAQLAIKAYIEEQEAATVIGTIDTSLTA